MFMIAFWRKSKQGLSPRAGLQIALMIAGGVCLLPIVVLLAYHLAYIGKVYPGIAVAGVDLSNKTLTNAEVAVSAVTTDRFVHQPAVALSYEGNEWHILKAAIHFQYQPQQSVAAAYQTGRSGQLLTDLETKRRAWFSGTNLPIIFTLDEHLLDTHIASIAAEVAVPPVPPAIEALDRPDASGAWVQVMAGESGQVLQADALKGTIRAQLIGMSNEPIVLPVEEVTVAISEAEIQRTRERAERLVKRQLTVSAGDQSWTVDGQALINFLDFHGGFDVALLHDYVTNLATSVDRAPQNGAFQYVDGRVTEFRPAQDGLKLQKEMAIKNMLEALASLETLDQETLVVELPADRAEPDITLAEVNNLGIRELLGRGMSTYKGSIPGRIHNVGLSASRINGMLVAPGETFSFNNTVGEISATTGYQQAYVIRSGATVLDDGGGVCQTSSTLFRATLDAGLPVTERKAHSYRVGYYEQNAKAGLDATVYSPTADLKFLNDTPGHILVQTNANSAAQSLVVEIYGTSDGRVAEIGGHRIWDVVPAPPARYQDDPTLPAGATKQVDWAASGAKAKFDYTVKRNGEIIFSKTFLSVYRPWQAVFLRGVGG